MNWLQFTADMTGHLAWPAMLIVAVLVLRKPLLALLPELQRLKIKDFEFDFRKTLDEAKREVGQIPKPSDDGKSQPPTTKAQGTAAELMKRGMLALDEAFKSKKLDGHILLQIHDELLISVPENEKTIVEAIVKKELESVVDWGVPLVVTTRFGANWKDVTK